MTQTELLLFRLYFTALQYIQGVPGGNITILGGHSIGHTKQKLYMYSTYVLFRTVSETELFH